MRRIGFGTVLSLAVAVCAAATGTASAAAPEFGRCVKVANGAGVYATANCTSAGGERRWEWLPGAGQKNHFTTSIKPKTFVEFQPRPYRGKVVCSGETGTGEISGPTTVENVTLTLTGCERPINCETDPRSPGPVILSGLKGRLGVIKAGETPLKDKIGLDLRGENTFFCGQGIEKLDLSGSAIGVIAPTDSMTTLRTWPFSEVRGKQSPDRFEAGVPETMEWMSNGSPAEPIGLQLRTSLTTEEKIEINSVV
jgi:hypothetical protein